MQAYAVFAVNQQLEFLLDEAARRRTKQASKPSLRMRLAAAVQAFRTGSPATAGRSVTATTS